MNSAIELIANVQSVRLALISPPPFVFRVFGRGMHA
jgi:hypothetical protein